jgi:hypothetical protein
MDVLMEATVSLLGFAIVSMSLTTSCSKSDDNDMSIVPDFSYDWDYYDAVPITNGVGVFIGAIICTIVTEPGRHERYRKIVNAYNSSLNQSNIHTHQSSLDLSLTTTDNGLGLRLTY